VLGWRAYGARSNGAVLSTSTHPAWLGDVMEDHHDASGLLYRRNRYYNPQTGRFTQEDPIGLAGGMNVYGFADGDPATYADPYGLVPVPLIVAGIWVLRAAPAIIAGARFAVEAADPNPDMGTAIVSGGKVVMRAAGQAGRRAFGRTTFRGLVQNRRIADLTHNQIAHAFENTPYTISSHAISRLKDGRTGALGAETLNDIARILNRGEVRDAGGGDVAIQLGRLEAIVNPVTKVITTIRPYRER
jgi:RHS repeat-associated protein